MKKNIIYAQNNNQNAVVERPLDGGATAAIIAAIIGAVATTATASASAAQAALANPDNRGMVVSNATQSVWYLAGSPEPFWGTWVNSPNHDIAGVNDPEIMFEAWKESGEAIDSVKKLSLDELSEAQVQLLVQWVDEYFEKNTSFQQLAELKGNGSGLEGLALYYTYDKSYAMAVYIDHSPGSGTTSAAAIFQSYSWMTEFVANAGEEWGSAIRDYLNDDENWGQNVGWSDGGAIELTQGDYSLTFQAGIYTIFSIRPAPAKSEQLNRLNSFPTKASRKRTRR